MPPPHHLTREYELELAEEMLARAYVQSADPDFRRFVVEVFEGRWREELDELSVQLWDASEMGRRCADVESRSALGELLEYLGESGSALLSVVPGAEGEKLLLGLIRLAEFSAFWLQPLAGWSPPAGDVFDEFGSLARYLLARYPVPVWMDALLCSRAHDGRAKWFLHVAMGQNLRTAPGLPVPLSKKMAHVAMETEADASFVQAVRRGQILGLGGSEDLAREIGRTWLGGDLASPVEEAWWSSVFQWLVNHPDLKRIHVGPLLDYLRHLKRRDPALSMRGRGLAPLLAGMEAWHRDLRRERRRPKKQAAAKPEPGFSSSGLHVGLWRFGRGACQVTWVLEEILTCRQLFDEGAQQHHCVASYEGAVRSGRVSIWSLRQQRSGGSGERALTIEVHNETRTIVQARGSYNRSPSDEELRILQLWAHANDLRLDLE